MNVIIMGCGRGGAELATTLDREGHAVTILDINAHQFTRFLPETFGGRKMVGNGIDQDTLLRAGIEDADAFVAVTQGDNRNVMACQIAQHIYNVERVVCRIYDPIREQMYHRLGLRTICPTKVTARLLKDALEAEHTEGEGNPEHHAELNKDKQD